MKITPFKLERFYLKHEFTAKYLLCNSGAESMTIYELLLLKDKIAYTEAKEGIL